MIVTDDGLFRTFLPSDNPDDIKSEIEEFSLSNKVSEDKDKCRKYVEYINNYFKGKNEKFELKIDWRNKTDFQKKVYSACMQIPYGQTRSYWWLSVRIGNPHSARAVGGAMASNPIPIIVPCHRVIRADNTLGGFGGGLDLKISLLKHEGYNFEEIKDRNVNQF